jgi:hypothetical protein
VDRSRDLRRGRVALRAALTAVKVGVLTMLLVGSAAGVVHSAATGADGRGPGCPQTGRNHDRPAPALIRTGQGQVRQVSFEVAWDVYQGRRPGTVLAVCVDGSGRR